MQIVISVLKEILKAVLVSLLTEEFIKEIIVHGLEWAAKKTDNNVDDEMVASVKKALEKPK